MECKLKSLLFIYLKPFKELIDTLWNVNVSELVKGLEDTLN